ncbi:1-acyl-sn-glycerol-3-phosphate acyltransferase [Aliiglaciecola litoralis]|uniref:Lysophospholipid acyltransferase family protein n=1 Tax=Aliiglaciecola litoralis TaxID=582857 RepID=A0ABP3WNZ2_9ALTE
MSKPMNTPKISTNIPRLGNGFSQWLGATVIKSLGWQFDGEFPEHPKMVVAVAPHTSNWDFVIGLAVVFALKLKISFFGKHSIFIPPFRQLLIRWGGIPIERSQSHGVVAQMIGELKQAKQMILCVAPEGTRSLIYPWKTGFLHIAQQSKVPVFLIGLDYKHKKIKLGPVFLPTEDIHLEMQKVYDFYAKVDAKYPSQVAFPAENSIEE